MVFFLSHCSLVPISEFDKTVALNLRGTFLCFQNAARVMIARGKGGRIIGSSSVTGKQGIYLPSTLEG